MRIWDENETGSRWSKSVLIAGNYEGDSGTREMMEPDGMAVSRGAGQGELLVDCLESWSFWK